MSDEIPAFMPLVRYWPGRDSAITVFRYALVRAWCRGKRVLEIGAAAGEGTALLADAAAEIVALDRQDLWDGSPAQALPNIRFVQADALDLPADWEGRFDVVVALELIEHLSDPETFQRAAFRVLVDGGTLLLSTPNFELYSRACDGDRTPLYCHHVREYCAAELSDALLDVWSSRRISGISQLSFPGDALSPDAFVLLHGPDLYSLVLGERYPDYRLCRAGALAAPLDLHALQSFLAVLGKGAAQTGSEVPFAEADAAPLALSTTEAALLSCQTILRRKNEQIRELAAVMADRDRHIQNLEGHAADLQATVVDRQRHVENLERHAANLQGIAADREARLADAETRLHALTEHLDELKRRLPYRIANWISKVGRTGRPAPVARGPNTKE